MTTEREVQGIITINEPFQILPAKITVRWTSDERGQTLSLSLDGHIQLTIPFEAIKDLVEIRNNGRERKGD